MATVKHTKNALKEQRDALARFERFLPMLQLKKQQLQIEIRSIDGKIDALRREREALDRDLESWIKLFTRSEGLDALVYLEETVLDEGNIAGVAIPIVSEVRVHKETPDLFATPAWFDAAIEAVEKAITLRIRIEVFAEQRRRVADELRVTTQRVNLFEKVKIPECRENIRVIRIFLGDEQTAAVARAKIAKSRGP